MKTLKKALAFALALMMVLSLAACGSSEVSGTEKTNNADSDSSVNSDEIIYITMGHGSTEDTAQHQAMLAMKDYIETESNGRMQVSIYPNNQLGANREMTEAVISGNLTVMMNSSATQTVFIPDYAIFDAPFGFADEAAIDKTISDETLMNLLNQKCEEQGMKLIMHTQASFRQLSTADTAVHTPDDMKGLTIRVQENPYHIAFWNACGANATPLAFNELYTALQQGTVDGQENPIDLFVSMKFYEQQNYLIKTNHIGFIGVWICNLDWYNSLPDDCRQIFDDACKIGIERNNEFSEQTIAEKETFLKENGVTVIELTDDERSAFREATQPVWDQIEQDVDSDVWSAFQATLS